MATDLGAVIDSNHPNQQHTIGFVYDALHLKDRDEDSGKENDTNEETRKTEKSTATPRSRSPQNEKLELSNEFSNDNEIPKHIQGMETHGIGGRAFSSVALETASATPVLEALTDDEPELHRLVYTDGNQSASPDSLTAFNDDKSEVTRPDPPSTTDGRDAAEVLGDDDHLGNHRSANLLPKIEFASEAPPIMDFENKGIADDAIRAKLENCANSDCTTVHHSPCDHDQSYGADNLALLPPVDEDRFLNAFTHRPYQKTNSSLNDVSMLEPNASLHSLHSVSNNPKRRKIQLRLCEEVWVKRTHKRTSSLLGTLRNSSTRMLRFGGKRNDESILPMYKTVERGSITVSWYNGTSSLELQQHVRRSVVRQIKVENPSAVLDDYRILDESTEPAEEIVISPFIPDGSSFTLLFSLINDSEYKNGGGMETPSSQYSSRPPLSPSAAPSPYPSDHLANLDATQLSLLSSFKPKKMKQNESIRQMSTESCQGKEDTTKLDPVPSDRSVVAEEDATEAGEASGTIDARLEEIRELLLNGRPPKTVHRGLAARRQEKQQVVFVVANYFVLFLALIALSAEMQARAPNWMKMMENHLKNVRNCSENQEALFECISRGDFAGLIASVGLWLSRSVTTRRIFLFGFDTPKKLWTVVYESLVSSICWGISYVFIRRGMNPDTRHRFIQKYWKDAVYGSLAGFNATFLKMVLKNLVPQETVEDAFKERQLRFLSWLPSFHKM